MKLLFVEDSKRLQNSVGKGLEREGFAVDIAGDGEDGFALARAYDYDVVILDLMIPKMDGLTLLKKLRQEGKSTHVLILSAKDQVHDRIRGLEVGADDYLIKPFDFDELVARVRALIRRRYDNKNPWVELGDLRINSALHQVFHGDREIPLTPKEYSLFEFLLMRRGRIVSRDLLVEHLYEGYGDIASNVVDVVICTLRKKIQAKGEPAIIETRRGFGYVIP